jgi:hypothetical protein
VRGRRRIFLANPARLICQHILAAAGLADLAAVAVRSAGFFR